mmetsp:Transcript_70396/g.198679  ORF Transcript_70396/g.198679 Transcript_70396/m.198679 type:complete len:347 (+) Transcript_70396:659-1699(+)
MPSSVHLSNVGVKDLITCNRVVTWAANSGRGLSSWALVEDSLRAILYAGVQDDGNRDPGSPTEKSLLKKRSRLDDCAVSSSLTSLRSFSTWVDSVLGGTKLSPSSRRSERCGLKMPLSKLLSVPSTFESTSLVIADQKASLTGVSDAKMEPQLPAVLCDVIRVGSERSNRSRFKSTPRAASRVARRPTTAGCWMLPVGWAMTLCRPPRRPPRAARTGAIGTMSRLTTGAAPAAGADSGGGAMAALACFSISYLNTACPHGDIGWFRNWPVCLTGCSFCEGLWNASDPRFRPYPGTRPPWRIESARIADSLARSKPRSTPPYTPLLRWRSILLPLLTISPSCNSTRP